MQRGVRAAALLGLATFLLAGASASRPLDGQFDRILQQAGAGIVRIDVQRAWASVVPDSDRPVPAGSPILHILGNGLIWDTSGHIITVCDLAQPGDTISVFMAGGDSKEGGVRRPGCRDGAEFDPSAGAWIPPPADPREFINRPSGTRVVSDARGQRAGPGPAALPHPGSDPGPQRRCVEDPHGRRR